MTTMDQYMSFSSFHLWFLIDNFGFEIEETKEMSMKEEKQQLKIIKDWLNFVRIV
jgi:hypothetical protein